MNTTLSRFHSFETDVKSFNFYKNSSKLQLHFVPNISDIITDSAQLSNSYK
jgi:hypothetical protein